MGTTFSRDTGGNRNIATKLMRAGPGIFKSAKFGVRKIHKIRFLKTQIRVAKNAGKVQISSKKHVPAAFGAISGEFSMNRNKYENYSCLVLSLGGPMAAFPWWSDGCYSTGLEQCLQYFCCHPNIIGMSRRQ